MVAIQQSTETPLVACESCLKEIPRPEAINTEASDYVAHFRGIDCYRVWAERADDRSAAKRELDDRRQP